MIYRCGAILVLYQHNVYNEREDNMKDLSNQKYSEALQLIRNELMRRMKVGDPNTFTCLIADRLYYAKLISLHNCIKYKMMVTEYIIKYNASSTTHLKTLNVTLNVIGKSAKTADTFRLNYLQCLINNARRKGE